MSTQRLSNIIPFALQTVLVLPMACGAGDSAAEPGEGESAGSSSFGGSSGDSSSLESSSGESPDASDSGDSTTGEPGPTVLVDDLIGTWVSPGGCELPEDGQEGFSVARAFAFTPTEFEFTITLHGGPGCDPAAVLFGTVVQGTFEFGANSSVEGAIDSDFTLESTTVTPTAAGVDIMAMFCPAVEWAADETVDISDGICVGFPTPVPATCASEYEILAIDDQDRLFFGSREQDICVLENRPAMLGENWLVRAEPSEFDPAAG